MLGLLAKTPYNDSAIMQHDAPVVGGEVYCARTGVRINFDQDVDCDENRYDEQCHASTLT